MPTETIVTVFQTEAEADQVTDALTSTGIPETAIHRYARSDLRSDDALSSGTRPRNSSLWQWLTGTSNAEHEAYYERSVESGHVVLTVIADAAHADQVVSVLERHRPLELEEHFEGQPSADAPSYTGTAATGKESTASRGAAFDASRDAVATPARPAGGTIGEREETMPLAAEELEVGKREVDRGATRIRRYVVERPVEEQIRLRDESVAVFRRPASGHTVAPDAFTEKTIEMTETEEEAVVSKRAYVVEEVVIQKKVGERVETVRDTVRREEVDVTGPGGRAIDTDRKRSD